MITAEELQIRYLRDVFQYVARRIERREDAEDVTAEVFAAAFQQIGRFRGECSPRLWLFGIARRKAADSLRRTARRPETFISAVPESEARDESDPLASAGRAEARREIRRMVGLLNEDQRDALLMKYVEELSTEEIATVMGRSTAAVNSLLQRARAYVYHEGAAYFAMDSLSLQGDKGQEVRE